MFLQNLLKKTGIFTQNLFYIYTVLYTHLQFFIAPFDCECDWWYNNYLFMRYDDDNCQHFQDMKRDINSNFNDFRMNLHLIINSTFTKLRRFIENYCLEIIHTI